MNRQRETIGLRWCQNLAPSKASISAEDITSFLSNLQQSMTDDDGNVIPPQNVFHFDETNLSDDLAQRCALLKDAPSIQRESAAAPKLQFL